VHDVETNERQHSTTKKDKTNLQYGMRSMDDYVRDKKPHSGHVGNETQKCPNASYEQYKEQVDS